VAGLFLKGACFWRRKRDARVVISMVEGSIVCLGWLGAGLG
jgi:hypothetical protein